MDYKKLWTDMHSNIHHEQIDELPAWFEQINKIMDFWPVAYYPFYMRKTDSGLKVEDRYDDEIIKWDWEYVKDFTNKVNQAGFPMFMGYEWQGSGEDGDHNVFFLLNEMEQKHPERYQELVEAFQGQAAIGIPHHVAYQLGSRGKNWATHNPQFSPFAEIYSCHGCSETDDGPLPMNRHIHMGPRTGETVYERALEQGYQIGVIAAGDNHSVPAVFEHGSMCALTKDNTKEAIWDAFVNRRVYGVSQSRIEVDVSIDDACMGSEVFVDETANLEFHVKGTAAVDRIEILKDNILEDMVVHSGTWERQNLTGVIQFKFRIEFGWGPDTRVYPNVFTKLWNGKLKVDGKLLSIEKCWNNFGQDLTLVEEDGCEFTLTTYKSTASGKWMGPSNVTTEGFIFEIEADIDSSITFTIDGEEYRFQVKEILKSSSVTALWDNVKELTSHTWGDITHYRDDPWWHNAYKFKISRAYPKQSYDIRYRKTIAVEKDCSYRLRIWQKNNDIAWTSPISLVRGEKAESKEEIYAGDCKY